MFYSNVPLDSNLDLVLSFALIKLFAGGSLTFPMPPTLTDSLKEDAFPPEVPPEMKNRERRGSIRSGMERSSAEDEKPISFQEPPASMRRSSATNASTERFGFTAAEPLQTATIKGVESSSAARVRSPSPGHQSSAEAGIISSI